MKVLAASSLALLLCACPKEDESLTAAEARDATEESTASTQASALTTSSIEISTSFTLGQGVRQAANEVRNFVQSQLPCADIQVQDATLTITYGAKPGNCTYRGHTFTGSHSITVSKNVDNQVIVDHTWTDLSNGKVKVNGTAHVTWDFSAKFRNVKHDLTWTRLADGRTGRGTGDRTQTPLAGGIQEGIQVDGTRSWEGKAGKWDLAIEGVQMRWQDPIPQAGTYRLATPKGKSLSLSFQRVDEDTIHVTVSNGKKSFGFDVNSVGGVADKGEKVQPQG
jgi:hypothetical protein